MSKLQIVTDLCKLLMEFDKYGVKFLNLKNTMTATYKQLCTGSSIWYNKIMISGQWATPFLSARYL